MGKDLSTLGANEKQQITIMSVVKADFLPWLFTAGFVLLLFIGVVALVASVSANRQHAFLLASGTLYSMAIVFYWALIALACFMARRSWDKWTWVLVIILIVFFIPQRAESLAIHIFPNSILPALVAMIGLLAIGRILEYILMRHYIKLKQPTLSIGAISLYLLAFIGMCILTLPFFFP